MLLMVIFNQWPQYFLYKLAGFFFRVSSIEKAQKTKIFKTKDSLFIDHCGTQGSTGLRVTLDDPADAGMRTAASCTQMQIRIFKGQRGYKLWNMAGQLF